MGKLLCTITINGVDHRISNEGVALTNWWAEEIISFDPPQYSLATDHGGYCKLNFGTITLSPNLFVSDWPPPVKNPITIEYTGSTEALASTLFEGTAHLISFDRTSIKFDLYGEDETTLLLDETVNYDGDTVPLPIAFGTVTHVNPVRLADDPYPGPTYHKGKISSIVIGTNWDVYDDGVSINGNVVDNGDGTFYLTAYPVGEVTMSGVGTYQYLSSVFTFAVGRLGILIVTTFIRAANVPVNHWANTQMYLVDFLSLISSFFTHLFYFGIHPVALTRAIHVVDMLRDNWTRTIGEYQYFPSEYQYEKAISSITSSWIIRSPAQFSLSIAGNGYYVEDLNYDTKKTMDVISSGTTDSTTADKLEDSAADFITDGVTAGMTVMNTTDGTEGVVSAVDDLNTLSVVPDIFTTGEDYQVVVIYPYGDTMDVVPYTDVRSEIDTGLTNIMKVLNKPRSSLRMALTDDLPAPGESITFTDTSMVIDTTMAIRCRNITFDFSNDTIIIEGDGEFS